jgi:hypothetical protein
MNCANHPEAPVAAYCRTCGKPLCAECKREAQGTIFCDEHLPAAAAPPWTPPAGAPVYGSTGGAYVPPGTPLAGPPSEPRNSATAPALAFILGLIPGVGAIYNGQYAKGLIHAVVFGILISIVNNHPPHGLEPLIGIMIAVWVFYMAFEAYHTARKRRSGERVDEFSSLIDLSNTSSRFPAGALVLIGLGTLLLLDQTDLLPLDRLIRFWPVGLILIGLYMLYARVEGGRHAGVHSDARSGEAPHERG